MTKRRFARRSRGCSKILHCVPASATRRRPSPATGRGLASLPSRRSSTIASAPVPDLAIVASDPAFGGGGRALTEALWRAAVELGRRPELYFLRHRRLPAVRDGLLRPRRSVPQLVPGLHALNFLVAGTAIGWRTRRARARFVSAAVAPHGLGAALSLRPYGCWVATSVRDEWTARKRGVDWYRRLAHALGSPAVSVLERATLRRASVVWAISPASRRSLA